LREEIAHAADFQKVKAGDELKCREERWLLKPGRLFLSVVARCRALDRLESAFHSKPA
jgi:hypothetical protein